MTVRAELMSELLSLPEDERAELAETLWASLDEERAEAVAMAWDEEIERRADDEDDDAAWVDGPEALRAARAELDTRR